jgi:hypothetical protein
MFMDGFDVLYGLDGAIQARLNPHPDLVTLAFC